MEEFLDDVSSGQMDWKKLLEGFWVKFVKNVDAVKPLQVSEVIEKIDEVLSHHLFPPREDGSDPRVCPECGQGRLSIKLGKFGAFIGCSNYPTCKYTKPLVDTSDEEHADTGAIKEVADKVLGEMQGLNIYLKKGPYGFYVQLGEDQTATTEKPKRASLPKNIMPEELTVEQAERLLSLPLDLGEGVELNAGKFGPYIKCGSKSVSLRGTDNIFNMTLERAKELLAGAKEKPSGKSLGVYPKNKQDIVLMMGRYGPYLKCGRTNYALPKNISGHEPSLEEAIKIIEAKK
jgi:DNA topoisomerase-1